MPRTTSKTGVEDWLDSLDVAEVQVRDGVQLRAIGDALDALEVAEQNLRSAVEKARAAGDSWSAIGMVLGTSKQAAHRKFGRPEL